MRKNYTNHRKRNWQRSETNNFGTRNYYSERNEWGRNYENNQYNYNNYNNYQHYNPTPPRVNNYRDNNRFNRYSNIPQLGNDFYENTHYNDNSNIPPLLNNYYNNIELNEPNYNTSFANNSYEDNQFNENSDVLSNCNFTQMNQDSDVISVNSSLDYKMNKNEEGRMTLGSKENKMVKKHDLYRKQEPEIEDSFRSQDYEPNNSGNIPSYWQREIETNLNTNSAANKKQRKGNVGGTNKIEKELNKMLAKPVEISKGRSLLEKMGWTGGGLGKDGDGIVEPIIPKAKYATKTIGLGHGTEPERKPKLKPKPPRIPKQSIFTKPSKRNLNTKDIEFSNNFQTNLLKKILEFIKNDSEIYLEFDNSLWKSERKRIHNIVQKLSESADVEELGYEKQIDIDLAAEILENDSYVLVTESYGKHPNRKLRVYKEVQPYIYLIVPDDLRGKKNGGRYENYKLNGDELNDEEEKEIQIVTDEEYTLNDKINGEKVNDDEKSNSEQDSDSINANCDVEKVTVDEKIAEQSNSEHNSENISAICATEQLTQNKTDEQSNSEHNSENRSSICATEQLTHNNKTDEQSNSEHNSENVSSICATEQLTQNKTDEHLNSENITSREDSEIMIENKNDVVVNNIIYENDHLASVQESQYTPKALTKIVRFFRQFAKDNDHLELRFLGPFDNEELDAIRTFFDICLGTFEGESQEKTLIQEALNNENYDFEVQQDCNGSYVVFKSEKSQQLTLE